ncbi:hypothetical protein ANCCAN_29007, partial [Ancylostoma caninum]
LNLRIQISQFQVYDCELEKKASDEQRNPGSVGRYNRLFEFSGEHTGRALQGLQTILSKVDKKKVLEALHAVLHNCSSQVPKIVGPESNSFWMFGKTVPG